MEWTSKLALVGGLGVLLGAGVQKASDVREIREQRAEERRNRLESRILEQDAEIRRLKKRAGIEEET